MTLVATLSLGAIAMGQPEDHRDDIVADIKGKTNICVVFKGSQPQLVADVAVKGGEIPTKWRGVAAKIGYPSSSCDPPLVSK